jgi:hypothetical protein
MTLDISSAERLSKLLGMLGSTHDGERAAAGLKANQLVRDLGLTWSEIIVPPDAIPTHTDWHRIAEYCYRYRTALNDRDRAFVSTLLTWRGMPSERQQQWLLIYSRLHRGGYQ